MGIRHTLSRLIQWLALGILAASCSSDIYKNQVGTNVSTVNSGSLSCLVSSVTLNGTNVSLMISASGGTANYTVNSVTLNNVAGTLVSGSATFAASITDVLAFPSLTAATAASASGTVQITDAANTSASCSFGTPAAGSNSNVLACFGLADTSVPQIGQNDNLTFSASGGTAPYTFSGFNAGATVASQNVGTASGNHITAAVAYSAAGAVSATMQLHDAAGASTTCSVSLNVQSGATVNTPPPVTNVGAGFFIAAGARYNSYGNGHYCSVPSVEQWNAMGAPANVPNYGATPTAMTDDGQCPLPAGFFAAGGALFLASANHHYCQITSTTLFSVLGAPGSYPNYPVIPTSEVADAQCALPNTFFRLGGGLYYSDGGTHFCYFVSMPHYYNSGAPDSNSLHDFSPLPNSMVNVGQCGWSTGNPIYRLHWTTNGGFDFLFSLATNEGVPWYTLDGQAFTLLNNPGAPGAVAMYRCHHPTTGQHINTTAANCEGWVMDGPIGYVLAYQPAGAVPLYRLYYPPTGEHFTSKDAGEIANAVAYGWIVEGGQGYAF